MRGAPLARFSRRRESCPARHEATRTWARCAWRLGVGWSTKLRAENAPFKSRRGASTAALDWREISSFQSLTVLSFALDVKNA